MKKIISLLVVIFIGLFFMFGCSNLSYNAKLYDNANAWINEGFAQQNFIRNVYYDIEEGFLANEETYPLDRVFIIDNADTYNEIFVSNINELDVDFDNQILILYTFRAINRRNLKLVAVNKQDSKLIIEYEVESKYGVGDTSTPYQRWIVVKIDKEIFTSVEFKGK